ncbi:MAG: carotenoid biosynthesis protein [Bacteroidetes bacterium]|nr:carotenoid biosynthesis protein [Bacteroidota bacterium]
MKNANFPYRLATAIAIIFHAIGLLGILFFDQSFFINTSAINLLLMGILLIYTQQKPNKYFVFFLLTCMLAGMLAEIIGTHTGLLFGGYQYGKVLGPTFQGVPYIIAVNWFIIIYCSGISIQTLLTKLVDKLTEQVGGPRPGLKALSIIVDGATLAAVFDWVMEPVAIKLGYWQWLGNGDIPLFNYLSWFVVSALLLMVFQYCPFPKQNKFAINLLLIQVMFFLLLRTFL